MKSYAKAARRNIYACRSVADAVSLSFEISDLETNLKFD